jgi:tRNA(Ile)-lysidine synthase
LPVAVQRRAVQQQLVERGIVPEFDLIERLRAKAKTLVAVGARLSISRDETGRLGFCEPHEDSFQPGRLKLVFRGRSGVTIFSGTRIRWQIGRQSRFVRPQSVAGREFFDADKVGGEVVLRHWRAGDRFQPIGMKTAVKLQDLFTNAKIPRARRRELIVATAADGEIFWVEALRVGERFKLGAATARRLRWEWRKVV